MKFIALITNNQYVEINFKNNDKKKSSHFEGSKFYMYMPERKEQYYNIKSVHLDKKWI